METPAKAGEVIDESRLYALFSAGKTLDEFYNEIVVSGFGMETIQSSNWLKDGRMRSESEMGGQLFITIYDTDAAYTLDPVAKTAMKMPMDTGMGIDPVTAED